MTSEQFVENLLTVLPYWHYKIDKPFKQYLKDGMSLETYYCLHTLHKEGPMTMSELSQKLKITKQQATKIIDKLYNCQFIQRLYDNSDRRFIRIKITQNAIDYIYINYYSDSEFIKKLKSKINKEDIREFEKAIEILTRILPKLN